MMIKAVIFDFDGVIADTFEIAYGISTEIGYRVSKEEYRKMFDGNLFSHPFITSENRRRFDARQAEMFKELVIHKHVIEGLRKLKETYKLFIVTSNTEDALDMVFGNNAMHDIFDKVLGAQTHTSKVKKFEMIFAEHSVAECVFVTDTVGDIKEAHEVGLRTIAVDYGFHERERLEKASPYKVVSSFDEVVAEIEGL
jgi:phosphoglycolate phosphatase